ncbi:MAG: LacI family DNA-binding transcriptional regulator, partial [Blautia sp.]|nr:LacI family DNA-binding transcriptional regulator [Blautia sp.]
DSKNLEYNNPPITSIRFDTVRLGKMACAKLLNILGEKPLEDTVPLNYQVVLRESTQ